MKRIWDTQFGTGAASDFRRIGPLTVGYSDSVNGLGRINQRTYSILWSGRFTISLEIQRCRS